MKNFIIFILLCSSGVSIASDIDCNYEARQSRHYLNEMARKDFRDIRDASSELKENLDHYRPDAYQSKELICHSLRGSSEKLHRIEEAVGSLPFTTGRFYINQDGYNIEDIVQTKKIKKIRKLRLKLGKIEFSCLDPNNTKEQVLAIALEVKQTSNKIRTWVGDESDKTMSLFYGIYDILNKEEKFCQEQLRKLQDFAQCKGLVRPSGDASSVNKKAKSK
jgi:hypothetical protein